MKRIGLILFFIWSGSEGFAQLDSVSFLQKVKSSYYSVQSTALPNFSQWVTSDYFRERMKGVLGEGEYPLEMIWIGPDRLFFIKLPLLSAIDSIQSDAVQNLQLEMQQELKGILIDWQRFYGGEILSGVPPRSVCSLSSSRDTVLIKFEIMEQEQKIDVCFYFGENGLCLKLKLHYRESARDILIYPTFDYIDGRWLCSGWQTQIIENGDVQSGFLVQIVSEKVDRYWLPKKLNMQLQTTKIKDVVYKREYYFANTLLNRSIQLVE
jgi:hypothetical protein